MRTISKICHTLTKLKNFQENIKFNTYLPAWLLCYVIEMFVVAGLIAVFLLKALQCHLILNYIHFDLKLDLPFLNRSLYYENPLYVQSRKVLIPLIYCNRINCEVYLFLIK
jgi:hypothetical protein